MEQEALRFLKDHADSCELQLLLGRAYLRRGKLEPARQALEKAKRNENCRNRADLRLARILEDQGQLPQSRQIFLELYSRIEAQDGKDLGLAAIALQHLQQYRESNRTFRRAIQAEPDDLDTQIAWGNLFLEKYDPANASTSFSAALKINPNLPEGLLGMALTLAGGSSEQAEALLKKALKVNPNLEPAHAALAEIAIDREDFEAARKSILQCLEINPRSLKARSLQAVLHYARGEEQALDDALQALLELNPGYGDLYRHLARYCVTQRLYRQAVDFFREAIRLNPNLFSAYADLGVNLLRIGRESDAKEILETAYQVDPFNLWTVNTLRLMDSFENFEKLTTPHFSLKLHREEAALLGHYVPPLLEKAYGALSARYGFSPPGPVYFEMYPNHDDFAVRALGVPGLGALGVCFGPGIVMDSPRARPRGQFNWASTLWHEFAHVITLGMTDHHVPRWFSEGISVMEEHRAMPGWGDRLDLQTLKFIQQGKLLPIRELNGGFLRPQVPRPGRPLLLPGRQGLRVHRGALRLFQDPGHAEKLRAERLPGGYAPAGAGSVSRRLRSPIQSLPGIGPGGRPGTRGLPSAGAKGADEFSRAIESAAGRAAQQFFCQPQNGGILSRTRRRGRSHSLAEPRQVGFSRLCGFGQPLPPTQPGLPATWPDRGSHR